MMRAYYRTTALSIEYDGTTIKEVTFRYKDEGPEEAKETSGRIIDGVLYVFGGYNGSESKRIDAYDIQNNDGLVNVGRSADTAEFAVNSIKLIVVLSSRSCQFWSNFSASQYFQ